MFLKQFDREVALSYVPLSEMQETMAANLGSQKGGFLKN